MEKMENFKMYNSIGDKIMKLAIWLGILGIAATILGVLMTLDALSVGDGDAALYVLVVLVIVPAVGILSTWPLYGFGQLVNDIHTLAEKKE